MNDETKNLSPLDILDCTFDKPQQPISPPRIVLPKKRYDTIDRFVEKYSRFSHHDLLNLKGQDNLSEDRVIGEVVNVRNMGKIIFVVLSGGGALINLSVKGASIERIKAIKNGDIIKASGTPFRSGGDLLGLSVSEWELLKKNQ